MTNNTTLYSANTDVKIFAAMLQHTMENEYKTNKDIDCVNVDINVIECVDEDGSPSTLEGIDISFYWNCKGNSNAMILSVLPGQVWLTNRYFTNVGISEDTATRLRQIIANREDGGIYDFGIEIPKSITWEVQGYKLWMAIDLEDGGKCLTTTSLDPLDIQEGIAYLLERAILS